MPLRFDQPSLLGEWKGDPAIIHQALSQIHSASEGEKNRANAKAIAEEKAKAVKKPSFKISSAKSPFSKDRDNISARINTMLDPTVDDNTKAHLDQQNLQDVAQAEAQKKALEALEKSVVDIEQRHGKNARTKVFRDAFSDIYTNSTVADRDEKLTKAAEILAKPEEYIDGDGVVMDYFNKLTPVTPTYKSSKESGQTTKEDETVSHTRFPLDGDPALDSNGQQLMNNGVPVYKKRIANNPRELLGYADNYLKNNDEYSGILHKQTAKKYKSDFEKEVNNWASTFDTPPSEEEKQSFLQGLVANKTRNDIAEKFYKNDKAWIDATSKVSFEKPTESDIAKSQNKANLKKAGGSTTRVANVVFTDGADERKYYSTSKGGNMDFSTKGAIAVQQQEKNGTFKPTPYLSQSIQGDVWNLTNGGKMNIGGNENIQIDEFVPFIEIQGKNGQWIRRDVAPTEDIESVVKSSTQPVRVVTAAVGKVVPKGNKEMTLTGDDLALLEKLKASKFDDLSPEEKDRYGELSAIQKGEGNTIMFDAIKSNALKKVTGYSDMYDIYNDKKTEQNIKNKAKVHIDLEKLANETNTKNGFDKAKIDQQTRSGEENTIRQKRTVELYNQYKKLEDPEEKKAFIKANGIPIIDGKLDFNKATGKPTVEQPKPTVTRVKGIAVPTNPNNKPKEEEPQKGSFNDIYGKNHMTYVDVAKKHTGNTDELLSKFADWEKKNEGGNGGGYNWGTNDPSIDTKEKAIAKYKKEYLPMVKDLPEGVKNIGLQQAINIGDPWGAALTAAGVYDEKGNSSTAGVRGDNRRAKNQETIYKANQKAVFDSYNKDPEAFKQRYSKAVKYHYDNAKPIGSSNVSDKKAEELRNKYKY